MPATGLAVEMNKAVGEVIPQQKLEQNLTPEFVAFIKDNLQPGEQVIVRGSALNHKILGITPTAEETHLPTSRMSDIDLCADESIRQRLIIDGRCSRSAQYSTSSSVDVMSLRLDNGLRMDLVSDETIHAALNEYTDNLIEQFVRLVASSEIATNNDLRLAQKIIERLHKIQAEFSREPYDPVYTLAYAGFSPLESLSLVMALNEEGELEGKIVDPLQMIERTRLQELKDAQVKSGSAVGFVYPEDLLEFSPYYLALYLPFLAECIEVDNPRFTYQTYKNVIKLARQQVENHSEIHMRNTSPIRYALYQLGRRELGLKPVNPEDATNVLERLAEKAQYEFSRAAASDSREAIYAFFIQYQLGSLIVEGLGDLHVNHSLSKEEQYKVLDHNNKFVARLAMIYNRFYPKKAIRTIVDTGDELFFENEEGPNNISDVFAIVLAAEGFNLAEAQEKVAQIKASWQINGAKNEGWIYGFDTEFDNTIDEARIMAKYLEITNYLDQVPDPEEII